MDTLFALLFDEPSPQEGGDEWSQDKWLGILQGKCLATTEQWAELLRVSNSFVSYYPMRHEWISNCCFPIITSEIVEILAEILAGKRVVDAGAGSGFLSHQLQQRGVDVLAVDNKKTLYMRKDGRGRWEKEWTTITHGNAIPHAKKAEAVILSWPDLNPFARMLAQALPLGTLLLFQGEWYGCTADDSFFDYVQEHFTENQDLSDRLNEYNLSFFGLHDNWKVLTKKGIGGMATMEEHLAQQRWLDGLKAGDTVGVYDAKNTLSHTCTVIRRTPSGRIVTTRDTFRPDGSLYVARSSCLTGLRIAPTGDQENG